ncbi:Mov34/MPN/PAD-1 family protein [Phenylobacterium sp.]|uniref:Mov34/MPN/PAD-1 family protein n=1 Tax=Phenylobacterium sp. TaxID=1871053 RepID=UPI0035B2B874
MIYPIGASGSRVILAEPVLAHLAGHRQHRFWQSEAGGQLFARLDGGDIVIVEATGPRPSDRRGRNFYRPDKRAEQAEIDARHPRGLHFVGDWHTHPQAHPEPSGSDLASIADAVRRSRHDLNGFVLLIVGTLYPPQGLHVSVHDGVAGYRLAPSPTTRVEPCPPPREMHAPIRFI